MFPYNSMTKRQTRSWFFDLGIFLFIQDFLSSFVSFTCVLFYISVTPQGFEDFEEFYLGFVHKWWISDPWALSHAPVNEDGTVGIAQGHSPKTYLVPRPLRGEFLNTTKKHHNGKQFFLIEAKTKDGDSFRVLTGMMGWMDQMN